MLEICLWPVNAFCKYPNNQVCVNDDPNGPGNSNSDVVQSDLVSHRQDQSNHSESDNISDLECDGVVTDVTKVASGHLIQLKCRAGVTQSIFPSIVEMNEAVIVSSTVYHGRLWRDYFTLLPKFSDTSSLSNGCKCDNVKYIL